MLQAIQENINPRANTMPFNAFTNFIFVQPAKSMIVNAFDSWRYRLGLRDFDIILHRDADTAQEGLPSRMRPASPDKRSRCMHFLHPQVGGVSAAAELLEEFLFGWLDRRPPQSCWRSLFGWLDRSSLFAPCSWAGYGRRIRSSYEQWR